jgi:hypothetical protein
MNKLTGMLAAAIVATAASIAPANQIIQTENYGNIPNFAVPLTFNYFDGTLGTLNSVTIEVSMSTSGGFGIVDNDAVDPATVTIETIIKADATSGDVFMPSASAMTSVNAAFSLASESSGPDGAAIDGSAPDGGTLNVPVGTFSSGIVGTSAAQRNTFIGVGTYDIDLDASQSTIITVGGGVATGNNPATVDGFVRVIYDYTPIPEPTSVALLGLGSLVGLARRRRS